MRVAIDLENLPEGRVEFEIREKGVPLARVTRDGETLEYLSGEQIRNLSIMIDLYARLDPAWQAKFRERIDAENAGGK